MASEFGNPLRKFKLVFLGEQSGKSTTTSTIDSFYFLIVTVIKKFVKLYSLNE